MKQAEPVLSEKQKKRLAHQAWIERVKTVKSYYVAPCLTQTKSKQAFRQLATPDARKYIINRLATYQLGGFRADKLYNKFECIATGTTKNDYIEYCGMRITFEYDEPSAADYVKE
jgi:hypothetical protein